MSDEEKFKTRAAYSTAELLAEKAGLDPLSVYRDEHEQAFPPTPREVEKMLAEALKPLIERIEKLESEKHNHDAFGRVL